MKTRGSLKSETKMLGSALPDRRGKHPVRNYPDYLGSPPKFFCQADISRTYRSSVKVCKDDQRNSF